MRLDPLNTTRRIDKTGVWPATTNPIPTWPNVPDPWPSRPDPIPSNKEKNLSMEQIKKLAEMIESYENLLKIIEGCEEYINNKSSKYETIVAEFGRHSLGHTLILDALRALAREQKRDIDNRNI